MALGAETPAQRESGDNQQKMTKRRFFYRCEDCLTVAVTLQELPAIRDNRGAIHYGTCDACSGEVEFMGFTKIVGSNTLVRTEYQCACDGRCTSAMGPSCDCECGGENHGTQRIVEVIVDGQRIPKLMTPKDALHKAEAFRSLLASVETAWEAKYGCLAHLKRMGDYLGSGDYSRLMTGVYIRKQLSKAKKMSTHAGRNKRLQAILSDMQDKTVAAVA